MKLVIDSSVAVKWYVLEDGHEEAARIFLAGHALAAPDLLLVEVANVFRRKVRTGAMTERQAFDALARLPREFTGFTASGQLVDHAFELSSRLDHSVYDCVYLACTLTEERRLLVTADKKFVNKAANAGFGEKVSDLEGLHMRFSSGQERDNG